MPDQARHVDLQDAVDRAVDEPTDVNLRRMMREARTIVTAICFKMLFTRQLAHDVAEESLNKLALLVWRRDFTPGERAAAWIARILQNECISALRRTQTKKTKAFAQSVALHNFEETLQASPYESAAIDELAAEVRNAIQGLPPRQWTVVALHNWAGWSFDKIGNELALPKTTVISRHKAALKQLRTTIMKEALYDPRL